jgi:TonB family protein
MLLVFGYLFGNETRAFAQAPMRNCSQNVSANGNFTTPLIRKRVNPQYPGMARTDFVDGDVLMDVVIASDGSVRDIKVTHGLPQLISSATHAVSQWEYEPARINGVAIACKAKIKVSFKIVADPAAMAAANAAENSAPGGVHGVKPSLPPPPPGVMRISGRVMAGMLEKRVEPVYAADSLALDARGDVVLLATIAKTGEVGDVQVVSGPMRFRDAAIEAVKQWRYQPYLVEGEAVEVQTTIALNFSPPPR